MPSPSLDSRQQPLSPGIAAGIVRAIVSAREAVMRWLLAAVLCAAGAANAATALLVNARVHTLDPDTPLAQALGWNDDGRIVAVGTSAELRERWPQARIVDAQGRDVIPGLIDAHGHLMNLGRSLLNADLVGATSRADVIERLQRFASDLPEGAWLLGRGWDQTRWPQREFPTAADLDAAFPDRPVWLTRIDGHAGWANQAALRAANQQLDGDWQPEGGRILRDDGKATGVFIDKAMDLVRRAIPVPDADLQLKALERALAQAVKLGLTGVHDAGVSLEDLARYRRFADAGKLPLRVYAMADGDAAALDALCAMGRYTHPSGRLQMRAVKLYIDGALGSRGAALIEDYSDEPGNRGLLLAEADAFERVVRRAKDCRIQPASHAIGDRGNRVVLDTYAKLLGEDARADHRWRIEHAQVVAIEDIARFAALGVIASMQPTHATSDMRWAEDRLGKRRLAGAYAWRRFRDAGVALALGSDFPVEQVDPMLGLHAAVTRQDTAGKPVGGWLPGQRLSALESLHGFTLGAAHAGFAEDEVGSLVVGKHADFVVVSADVLSGRSLQRMHAVRVLATYVDGKPVYQAPPETRAR